MFWISNYINNINNGKFTFFCTKYWPEPNWLTLSKTFFSFSPYLTTIIVFTTLELRHNFDVFIPTFPNIQWRIWHEYFSLSVFHFTEDWQGGRTLLSHGRTIQSISNLTSWFSVLHLLILLMPWILKIYFICLHIANQHSSLCG